MKTIIYVYIILLTSGKMYGQIIFNSHIFDCYATSKDLTDDKFYLARSNLKIKQIIKKTTVKDSLLDLLYQKDSALFITDMKKWFNLNHFSSIQNYNYDVNGILEFYYVKPLQFIISKDDSLLINKQKIIVEKLSKQLTVSVFVKEKLIKQLVYFDNKLFSEINNSSYNLQKDSITTEVNLSYKLIYNKENRIEKGYFNNKLETIYSYSKNKIFSKNFGIQDLYREYLSTNNKIELNNYGQVIRSTFTDSISPKENITIYRNKFDDNHNVILTTIWHKYFNEEPETISEFKNIYINGQLTRVIDISQKDNTCVYTFDSFGYIKSIESKYRLESFTYTYY